MKKALVSVLVPASVLASGLTALAAKEDYDVKDVYNGVENSIGNLNTTGNISPDTHKTVIISRVADIDGIALTEEEVVYVDQSTSAYSTALEVMFNNELETGYYRATMGTVSDTSNSETVYFVVGDFNVDPEDKLTVLSEATPYGTDEGQTWYKKGFSKTVTFEEYNSFKSIKLISADGTQCIGAIKLKDNYTSDGTTPGYRWDRTALSGEGDVTIALQVYAIPAASTGFSLYFSPEDVVAQ